MTTTLITTPMYYTNGKPHIGHAYSSIVADFVTRWRRLAGEETLFITGTDEHGQKIKQVAEDLGKTPGELCDEMSSKFKDLQVTLNLSSDIFLRTTEDRHKKVAQAMWNNLKGYIYKGTYKGWYATRDEAYYNEGELIEKDGTRVAPTGAPVEWLEEESYFFKLSAFSKPLLKFYEESEDFIFPKARYNEVKRFVKDGLKDLCISRRALTWGVQVPEDRDHVMYVWLDALNSYISALSYPNGELFSKFWVKGNKIHVIGKDILRFHGVYWVAFLMAAGLPCPNKIVSHGWWKSRGEKMSKSVGNVIDPIHLVDEYGADYLRYFLLREVTLSSDGNFSLEVMRKRVESDLADNLGNLIHRTLSIAKRSCAGEVKSPGQDLFGGNTLKEACSSLVGEFRIKDALVKIMKFIQDVNKYVNEKEPWTLAKNEKKEELQEVLSTIIRAVRQSLVLLQPAIPDGAGKLLDMLEVPKSKRDLKAFSTLTGTGNFQDFQVVFKKFTRL